MQQLPRSHPPSTRLLVSTPAYTISADEEAIRITVPPEEEAIGRLFDTITQKL